MPPGLLQVKREFPSLNKRLSSGSSTDCIHLCFLQKKTKSDEPSKEKDFRDLIAEDVVLMCGDETAQSEMEEGLAAFLMDVDVPIAEDPPWRPLPEPNPDENFRFPETETEKCPIAKDTSKQS